MAATLPTDTRIGAVHLTVRDLTLLSRFYTENVGLERLGGDASVARLGVAGVDVVVLHAAPDAPRARGATGLYHLAILLPSREDLGRCRYGRLDGMV